MLSERGFGLSGGLCIIKPMKSSHLLLTAKILIFVVLIGTPVFYLKQGVNPYIFSKTLFFQFAVELLFAVWLALAVLNPQYRPKKTPLLFAGAGFVAVLFITALLGVDFHRSFWSTYERMLGVFAFLHLTAFALILSSLYREIHWKKILYVSLGAAAFVSILALIQKSVPNLLLNEPAGGRPGSTFGNPTFLAGYLSFNIFIGIYLILDTWKSHIDIRKNNGSKKASTFSYLRAACFVLALLLISSAFFFTETRGDILGLGFGLFILIAIFAFRPPELPGILFSRRTYLAVILFLALSGSIFGFTRQNSFWENVPGLNRFRDVSFSLSESNISLLPRFIALNAAWKGFIERPSFGWGWDNFNIVYNKYYDPRALELSYQETRFDKPHNSIAEDMVSGGIILLLARIMLFAGFIYEALKTKNLFGRIVLAALAGFVVRNLFIFDTLGPMLMFYTLAGLVDGEHKARAPKIGDRTASERFSAPQLWFAGATFAVVAVTAYTINIPSMKASYYEYKAYNSLIRKPTVAKGVGYFDKALALWSPYRWNFARDFAAAVSEAYFYNPGVIKKEDAARAIGEMERVAEEHPLDAYNHYALLDMYNQTSDIDPEKFLAAAEREAKIALDLSPDRQEIYFSLAKTKSLRGDYAGAVVVAKYALDLNPKVADAHFYYGLLLSANKNLELGYAELKKAMELGKRWKNFYEPRVVGDFFADAGHAEDAVSLYLAALAINSDASEIISYPLSAAEARLNSGIVFLDTRPSAGRKYLDDAIGFYKIVLAVDPDNLIAQVEIGAAYFLENNEDAAREYLGKAAKRPEFGTSLLADSVRPILERLGIQIIGK